jgi:hypothetical protein
LRLSEQLGLGGAIWRADSGQVGSHRSVEGEQAFAEERCSMSSRPRAALHGSDVVVQREQVAAEAQQSLLQVLRVRPGYPPSWLVSRPCVCCGCDLLAVRYEPRPVADYEQEHLSSSGVVDVSV